LGQAGCNYIMGVPCGDDIMLGYQSTSYHDGAFVRSLLGRTAAPEFQEWLEFEGIARGPHLLGSGRNLSLLESARNLLEDRVVR